MDKDQIDWRFKFLYCIAIISVIVSHVGGGINLFYDWFDPYAFHLPLFIFSSGYFYKDSSTENCSGFVFRKIKKLIIPLYLWNLFYGIVVWISKSFGFSIGEDLTLYNLLLAPIMDGRMHFRYNGGSWFVFPLFMVQVLNILLRKILNKNVNEIAIFVFYMILGLVGIRMGELGVNTGLYLVMIRIFRMLPYYELGILYNKKIEDNDNLPSVIYFLLIILFQLILITFNHGKQITLGLDSCSSEYMFILSPYIASFLGIAFWLRIANILLPVIRDSKFIKVVCDNAYSIMVNQFIGFMFVKQLWAIITKAIPLEVSFNMNEYKSNLWYYFYIGNRFNFNILYIVAGLVIPIIMQHCVNRAKAFWGCK